MLFALQCGHDSDPNGLTQLPIYLVICPSFTKIDHKDCLFVRLKTYNVNENK